MLIADRDVCAGGLRQFDFTYGGRVGQGDGVICDRAASNRSCATEWKRGIAGRFGR